MSGLFGPSLDDFPEIAKVYEDFKGRDVINPKTGRIFTKEEFYGLAQDMKNKAFFAVQATDEVMRQKFEDTIARALAEGMTEKQFRDAMGNTAGSAAYLDMVFQLNVANAYRGALYADMFGALGSDYSGVWQFWGPTPPSDPKLCPGLICMEMYGQYLRKNDPEARRRLPPVHWGCYHSARDVMPGEAAQVLIVEDASVFPEPDPDWDFDKTDLIPESFR